MTLPEIEAIVTARLPTGVRLDSSVEDHDGIVMTIGTDTADGRRAVSCIVISRLTLACAKDWAMRTAISETHVDAAVDSLRQAVQKFHA